MSRFIYKFKIMIELKVNLLTTKDPNKVREILKNLIDNDDFGVEVQCATNTNSLGYGLVRIADINGKLQPCKVAEIAIGIVRNLYKHEEIELIEIFKMPNKDEDSECFIWNYTNGISPNEDNYIPIKK